MSTERWLQVSTFFFSMVIFCCFCCHCELLTAQPNNDDKLPKSLDLILFVGLPFVHLDYSVKAKGETCLVD